MTAQSTTCLLRIHGLVQGVYYRKSMTEAAQRLGVQGWVRNRSDGSVEALVAGPAHAVQALIEWAHEGPPAARVDRVQVQDAPPHESPGEALRGFVQRETI
ncbi:acylphosphatase [Diaphorobacter sp.]|uniref:acylphosphatase n=1 Tax=Diaphorobacter sp. TaxID=1934310 RepID=UPI003D10BD92